MNTGYLEVNSKHTGDSEEALIISGYLKNGKVLQKLDQELVKIFEPLGADERINLLERAHFPVNVTKHINTELSPTLVATKLSEISIFQYDFPATAYLLQLVGLANIQVEGIANTRVSEALSRIFEDDSKKEESIRETMNSHFNSHKPPENLP